METIFAANHAIHAPRVEMADGGLKPAVEVPQRAENVRAAVEAAGLGAISVPDPLDRALLTRVHDADYVDFLERFSTLWLKAGREDDHAFPFVWPTNGLARRATPPRHIDGLLGHYSFDAGTALMPGTAEAALEGAAAAATAANRVVAGASHAFALSRPPGHHAMPAALGGYCYLANAAIATEALLAGGAARVAVLDIDYHHGNGTEAIFAERADVMVVSLHCDPADEFPYFAGHGDFRGRGAGEGMTVNLPLPPGTDGAHWLTTLGAACRRIGAFGPDALVVSLGLDAYKDDPLGTFLLEAEDFTRAGAAIATLGTPTATIFEGGYAVDALGGLAVNFFKGLLKG